MISIIIPTYNEAGNIKSLIEKIFSALKGYKVEIIVVDDNSPDETWKIVQKLQTKNPRIKLFRRLGQLGLTSAYNFGISQSKGNIIGWMDADLSHPPDLLKKMITLIPQYDIITASRYLPGGKDLRRNRLAVILSDILHYFAMLILGNSLTDYTSGYILAKKKIFDHFILKGDYGEYFIDMIDAFNQQGYKIKELPYVCRPRTQGESKTATTIFGFIKRGYKYILIIIRVWLKRNF